MLPEATHFPIGITSLDRSCRAGLGLPGQEPRVAAQPRWPATVATRTGTVSEDAAGFCPVPDGGSYLFVEACRELNPGATDATMVLRIPVDSEYLEISEPFNRLATLW